MAEFEDEVRELLIEEASKHPKMLTVGWLFFKTSEESEEFSQKLIDDLADFYAEIMEEIEKEFGLDDDEFREAGVRASIMFSRSSPNDDTM